MALRLVFCRSGSVLTLKKMLRPNILLAAAEATVQSKEERFQEFNVMGHPPNRSNRLVSGVNPIESILTVSMHVAYILRAIPKACESSPAAGVVSKTEIVKLCATLNLMSDECSPSYL